MKAAYHKAAFHAFAARSDGPARRKTVLGRLSGRMKYRAP